MVAFLKDGPAPLFEFVDEKFIGLFFGQFVQLFTTFNVGRLSLLFLTKRI